MYPLVGVSCVSTGFSGGGLAVLVVSLCGLSLLPVVISMDSSRILVSSFSIVANPYLSLSGFYASLIIIFHFIPLVHPKGVAE